MIYDLIIIGASAAGMSAGIYAARAGLNFVIISKDKGGNTANAGVIENYLGTISKPGLELSQEFENHLKQYNPEIIIKEVQKVNKQKKTFIVEIQDREFESQAVIVATGTKYRKLNIEGEKEFFNKGISYCETCDGPIFTGKDVAIIGGGNSALKATVALSKIAFYVYLIAIEGELEGEKIVIEKLKQINNIKIICQAKTIDFFGKDFLEGLHYQDLTTNTRKEIKVNGVFIYVGVKPNTKFVSANLDILNKKKEIITDKYCQTKVPGLFAAGDVVDNPYRQISIAVGEGTKAALGVINYLDNIKKQ